MEALHTQKNSYTVSTVDFQYMCVYCCLQLVLVSQLYLIHIVLIFLNMCNNLIHLHTDCNRSYIHLVILTSSCLGARITGVCIILNGSWRNKDLQPVPILIPEVRADMILSKELLLPSYQYLFFCYKIKFQKGMNMSSIIIPSEYKPLDYSFSQLNYCQ